MKRILAGFLCSAVALGSFTGCNGNTSAGVVKASTVQAETEQTQKIVSENAETIVVEEDVKETDIPITLDPDMEIEKGIRIAVVARSTEGSYWKLMKKCMKDTVDYINEFYGLDGEEAVQMTFEGPDSDTKVDDQINTIDAVLAENPSALCLSAIDMNSCQAQMETARDNGIPVVLFHSKVKNDMGAAFCAIDNHLAGAKAAEEISGAIGEKGRIAVFGQATYDQVSKSRMKGFREEIEKNHEKLKISEHFQDQEEDIDGIIHRILEKGKVSAIFCTNQALTEKVLAAMKGYPDNEIVLVGSDAGKAQMEAIEAGSELGTIVQSIPHMAGSAIWMAVTAASPKCAGKLEKNVKTEYIWVSSHNLEEAEQSGLLYE